MPGRFAPFTLPQSRATMLHNFHLPPAPPSDVPFESEKLFFFFHDPSFSIRSSKKKKIFFSRFHSEGKKKNNNNNYAITNDESSSSSLSLFNLIRIKFEITNEKKKKKIITIEPELYYVINAERIHRMIPC